MFTDYSYTPLTPSGNHRLFIECPVKGAERPTFELEVDQEIKVKRPTVGISSLGELKCTFFKAVMQS